MFNRKAQSTLEYALIIGVVVAGLLLMQHYVRRGLAGRFRASSDDLGEQFDPAKFSSDYTTTQTSGVRQSVTADRNAMENRNTKTEHLIAQENVKSGEEGQTAWTVGESLYSN